MREMTLQDVTSVARARELATLLRKDVQDREWAANSTSQSNCCCPNVEVVEMIDVLSECGPGFGDGWEAGSPPNPFRPLADFRHELPTPSDSAS